MDLLFGKARKESCPSNSSPIPSFSTLVENDSLLLNLVDDVFATRPGYNPHEYRWGDGSATILDFYLSAQNELYPSVITTGQTITLGVVIRFHVDLVDPILGITIKTKAGVTIYGANSRTLQVAAFKSLGKKDTVIIADAVFICRLAPGDYFVSLGIATQQNEAVIPHDRRYDALHLQVSPVTAFFGLCDLELELTAQEVT